MTFQRITEDEHLWSVKDDGKELSEFDLLFEQWNDVEYLYDFFKENKDDLKSSYYGEISVQEAVRGTLEEAESLEEDLMELSSKTNLDSLFRPLSHVQYGVELIKAKARGRLSRHENWLRIYALKIEPNVYLVTGGAIKLTRTMQERPHTNHELYKLESCRNHLIQLGIYSIEGLKDK